MRLGRNGPPASLFLNYRLTRYREWRYRLGMAKTLKQARRAAGLTQMRLSALARVSQTYISDLEAGRQANPSFVIARRLEKALNCELRFASNSAQTRETREERRTA